MTEREIFCEMAVQIMRARTPREKVAIATDGSRQLARDFVADEVDERIVGAVAEVLYTRCKNYVDRPGA